MKRRDLYLVLSGTFLIFILYGSLQFFVPVKPVGAGSNAQLLLSPPARFEILIPKGMSFRAAVEMLYEKRLLRDRSLFILLGRITGLDRRLRYGYYQFIGSVSPFELFKKLLRGEIEEYEITIIEGSTIADIAQILEDKGIIDKERFLDLARDRGLLKELSVEAPSLEGYLFPTTYKIPKGTDPVDIIRFMVNTTRRFLSPYVERAEEIGLTENQLLTLASIIEKEAKVDYERPLISAVYHNRMRRGMRLQADPTAVYDLKGTKKLVTRKDLLRNTRYNTYIHRGLPPGPIASPGLKSVIAALNPADVPYLYFVSNNDGTHNFSVSFEEHIKYRQEYIKRKRSALSHFVEDKR
jgi:UPF0755 protein